ncbi:MAG TPA: branched-chain amino acid ABC transporter permease [Solirubrobacteraceae bacterium]|nr:branched-chain amino acid ABC transporter permease [Solirubrobacteraceae bacterium]
MSLATFLDQLFAGLGLGFVLFFSAAGLNLVWGVLGVMNFAAGAVYMLGAYLATSVIARVGASTLGWLLALALVPLLMAALGALAEMALLRRTYRARDENQQFMLTLALSYLIAGAVVLVYGPGLRSVSLPSWLAGSWRLAGATLPIYTAVVIALGVAVAAAIWGLLYRTRVGLLTRAAVDDRTMLAVLGVDVGRLYTAVFAFGIALGALGGVVDSANGAVTTKLETAALVPAFIVVVTGGLGNMTGALLAAIGIGVAQSFVTLQTPTYAPLTPYAAMTAVLLARAVGGRTLLPDRAAVAR